MDTLCFLSYKLSKEGNNSCSLNQKESRLSHPEEESEDYISETVSKPHNSRKRGKIPSNGNSVQKPPEKRLHLPARASQNGSTEQNADMSVHHNGLKNPTSPSSSENSSGSSSRGMPCNEASKLSNDSNNSKDGVKEDQATHGEDWKEDKKDEENPEEGSHTLGFNDDAICEHGM